MTRYTPVLTAAVCMALALAVSPAGQADTVSQGQKVQTWNMTDTDPLPPTDIYRPGPSTPPKHKDLATFAWLEFIALSAIVDDSMRGSPGGSFADSGFDPAATLVWETYQHRSELFPYNAGGAVEPQPWNATPLYVFSGSSGAYIPPFDNFNNLDEASQIGQNTIFFPYDGGDGDAQLLFQAKVNKVESDYVREMVMNPSATQGGINLPDNVIEVKSAWIALDAIPESERYRYHTSEVIIYTGDDDNPVATTETRALLGLHIIQKTPNYPAFIFATFEHTDILVDPVTNQDTGVYYIPAYDEIEYAKPSTTKLAASGETVVNPNILFFTDNPYAYPNYIRVPLPLGSVANIAGATDIGDGQYAIPVVQPPTTNKDVAKANQDAYQAMTKIPGFDDEFVWQYYQLKGVQGVPTNNDSDEDFYLANIVIESSQPGIQLFRGGFGIATTDGVSTLTNTRNQSNVIDEAQGGQTFSVGGCQGCHGVAQTQAGFDFSFLFGAQNGKGFAPDTIGVKSREEMLERLVDYSLTPPTNP